MLALVVMKDMIYPKQMPQNLISSYQLFSKPVIASYITLCIMRSSFLSQVEITPKGKASVNNKHVTYDLLFFNLIRKQLSPLIRRNTA